MSVAGVIYSSGNTALLTNIFGNPPRTTYTKSKPETQCCFWVVSFLSYIFIDNM